MLIKDLVRLFVDALKGSFETWIYTISNDGTEILFGGVLTSGSGFSNFLNILKSYKEQFVCEYAQVQVYNFFPDIIRSIYTEIERDFQKNFSDEKLNIYFEDAQVLYQIRNENADKSNKAKQI